MTLSESPALEESTEELDPLTRSPTPEVPQSTPQKRPLERENARFLSLNPTSENKYPANWGGHRTGSIPTVLTDEWLALAARHKMPTGAIGKPKPRHGFPGSIRPEAAKDANVLDGLPPASLPSTHGSARSEGEGEGKASCGTSGSGGQGGRRGKGTKGTKAGKRRRDQSLSKDDDAGRAKRRK
ncbi:hypothetical protein FA95DRAFT_1610672 [Auriscalpium vulgare]|uniref:Uncharacterized protein n=1 Tax=Auriscalpium vulgare TaxID=40419 RepID=A0ACB8RDW7_9AGAM|nr:hypothetical protein FA95DRAFT_1610672 [Auriscalpium vulgare]